MALLTLAVTLLTLAFLIMILLVIMYVSNMEGQIKRSGDIGFEHQGRCLIKTDHKLLVIAMKMDRARLIGCKAKCYRVSLFNLYDGRVQIKDAM